MPHETYMQRCLDLAVNGLGSTAPNPMVGAVIVNGNRIIGEGFHTAFGKTHAEVEAIRQVADPALLPDSTLYVNLEPCNHTGKTPPCTDLILKKKIGRVVIGQADPNPGASGGVNRLRDQGVEVITGVLEKESRWLNRRFNTSYEKRRPWLVLKWAQTLDGFVDALRNPPGRQLPTWITDETCRRLVHKWRSEEQAIMAGSQTILLDDPQLDVREWSGKNPLRVTIDRNGRLFSGDRGMGDRGSPLNIMNGGIPTIVFTCMEQSNQKNLEFVRISPGEPVWPQVLRNLHQRNIQSMLIEGGPTLFETLIQEDLWDEARVFIGPGWFGSGVRAPHFPFEPARQSKVGNSRLLQFYREELT